ncbi:MAG: class I SAM-dependent methyltransferase, partial [Promethearchaeota archaeon]
LIELAYGNILDIGSCTGYYIPYLAEKGTAIGIDISDRIIAYAHKRGIHNCVYGDIFHYKFNTTFDTITLIGNDIALTGTLFNLKRLLKRFYRLLNPGGQILAITRHIAPLKYWHVVYVPEYEGKIGPPLKCLFINVNYFMNLSRKYGFTPEIITSNDDENFLLYFVRLIKN